MARSRNRKLLVTSPKSSTPQTFHCVEDDADNDDESAAKADITLDEGDDGVDKLLARGDEEDFWEVSLVLVTSRTKMLRSLRSLWMIPETLEGKGSVNNTSTQNSVCHVLYHFNLKTMHARVLACMQTQARTLTQISMLVITYACTHTPTHHTHPNTNT